MKISSMTSHQIRVAGALVMGLAVTATWAQTEKAIAIAARSDTGLRPEVAERKTVPLAGLIDQAPSTLRLSVQNRKIAMPNEATRVMAVSVCQGMVVSKEQARAGGTICAPVAGARNAQLADATAPQSDAFRAMQKAKSIQEEAAPELLPASDGWVHPHPTWIASQAVGSTPLVLKAGPGDIEAIPTLSQWSLILLTGLLGAVSFWQTRNRKA